jgi:hypothetical protein
MEEISWTDLLKYAEVLNSVMEEMNILHTVKSRKTNWIGHILHSKYFLKYVTKERYKWREDEEEDVISYGRR